MKIKILQDCYIPNQPAFTQGQECDIIESVADVLCDRGLAELVKEKKSVDEKQNKKTK